MNSARCISSKPICFLVTDACGRNIYALFVNVLQCG